MRVLREECEIDEPDIGFAQQRCRHPVARHVNGVEPGLLDDPGAERIVYARRDEQWSTG